MRKTVNRLLPPAIQRRRHWGLILQVATLSIAAGLMLVDLIPALNKWLMSRTAEVPGYSGFRRSCEEPAVGQQNLKKSPHACGDVQFPDSAEPADGTSGG